MLAAKPASLRAVRLCLLGVATLSVAVMFTNDSADARRYRRHRAHVQSSGGGYSPAFSSIIIDANSGNILQATSADSLRHPASLTKIMTLYLLFERLDTGKIKLDSSMNVSEHASEQAPTKLGLEPGQSIRVEDAIKGLVTRSANDAAVVISEALGGSEDEFAKQMTRKARALGMSKTVYKNASGLPDDDQVTTARDQATLGRAIQDRFPKYYRYFATEAFNYHGRVIRNHNRLIGRVEGVDGIKTGYTRASGFNLVTSMKRGNRYMVGVVLGGRSGGSRDAIMRNLLAEHLDEASTKRTVAAIVEKGAGDVKTSGNDEPDNTVKIIPLKGAVQTASALPDPVPAPAPRAPSASAKTTQAPVADKPAPAPLTSGVIAMQSFAAIPGSSEPMTPVRVKTVQVRTGQTKVASAGPAPVATSAIAPPVKPPVAETSKAVVARAEAKIESRVEPKIEMKLEPKIEPKIEVQAQAVQEPVAPYAPKSDFPAPLPARANTNNGIGQGTIGSAAPAAMRGAPPSSLGAQAQAMQNVPLPSQMQPQPVQQSAPQPAPIQVASAQPQQTPPQSIQQNGTIKAVVRTGWIIQVGALESETEARQRLDAARGSAGKLLGGADPFTESVAKGNKTLYRARFAGLDQDSAEAACQKLKRSDISCITIRN